MKAESTTLRMGAREWVLLLLLSFLWGGSFFFIRIAVQHVPVLTVVWLRVGLSALALHAFLAMLGHRMPVSARAWLAFVGMGFLNNAVPFTLIVWGETHIGVGLASVLNATTPLCTALVAHGLTEDEKLSTSRIIGLVTGFLGVTVMIGPDMLSGLHATALSQFAILGAALSYACAGVFGRRFRRIGVTPMATATGQVTASTILLAPVALIVDRPWVLPFPPGYTLAAIIALALVSTALAYVIYFRILAVAGATNLLLVTMLIPVTAILLGVLVLSERLQAYQLLGMLVIASGLVIMDGRIVGLLSIGSPDVLNLIDLARQWWRQASGRRQLSCLGQRLREDIGMRYEDTWKEQRKWFWRK